MLIASAIGAVVLSFVVMALYQFNSLARLHQSTLTGNQQIQSVATMLNRDVLGAASGLVEADGQRLTLQIPGYPFGQVTSADTRVVVYSYVPAEGLLLRDDGGGGMVVGRHIHALSFGSNGPIGASVAVDLTTSIEGQSRTSSFSFGRRLAAE
jgi:hypothetical protein